MGRAVQSFHLKVMITMVSAVGTSAQTVGQASPADLSYARGIGALGTAADTATITNLGAVGNKWSGIAFAPNVDKLFAAPYEAHTVLMIDPTANTSDSTTLNIGFTRRYKYRGIAYASNSGKLYCAPYFVRASPPSFLFPPLFSPSPPCPFPLPLFDASLAVSPQHERPI